MPPAAQPFLAPAESAPLLERLFPTVPAWWIAARLACLVIGAVLIAGAVPRAAPVRVLRRPPADPPAPRGGPFALAALAVAIAQLALCFWVPRMSRPQQWAYVAGLGAPTLLLWLGTRRRTMRRTRSWWRPRNAAATVAALLAVWCAWRIPAALHSPRAASPIDTWLPFEWMLKALADQRPLIGSTSQPGVSDLYMIFLGLPLLDATGTAPTLAWVQAFHVLWILATAAGVAALAAVSSGAAAAPVAAAALLGSPLLLMSHLSPAPFGLMTALAVALLLLVRRLYVAPSSTALAALGAIGGLAVSFAYLLHLALAAGLATGVRLLRRPRLPPLGVAVGTATFLAAAIPALPDAAAMRGMLGEYVQLNWQWAGGEAVMLGQRSPRREPDMRALMRMGRSEPYDLPLAGLLMPFAIPRTGLRLSGDTLFEPLGAALAAVGLAACLRRPTRRGAAALLAVGALAVLPAVASRATDRVSMTRAIATPLAVALLAGAGFATLRRALLRRRAAATAAAATAAASLVVGAIVFDVVTPRLIPASWLEIAVRAASATDPRRVTVLEHLEPFGDRTGWLHVRDVATYLPARPFVTWTFAEPEQVLPPPTRGAPAVLLWSPALEEDVAASRAICARWPGAALYELSDRAGLARAFAASPTGSGWQPALAEDQWRVGTCDELVGRLRGRY